MANLGYIQIARRCNQQCLFCSNPPNGRILSLEQAKEFIDDFVRRDYAGILLTGGEPTLFTPLEEIIGYATSQGIAARIITNGLKTADYDYFKSLVDAGLAQVHMSNHSYKEKVHDYLTQTPGSLKKQIATLENAAKLDITIDINCVINKHNADHLHENVQWIRKHFPHVRHFVWNNLDPSMNQEMNHDELVPALHEFEISLYRAMRFLDEDGCSFRAEKVPLCYMPEYAHCSTETRKIVKQEERLIHFLDKKASFREVKFEHAKAEVCTVCHFNDICAGLFKGDEYYNLNELWPVFLDAQKVRDRVLHKNESQ